MGSITQGMTRLGEGIGAKRFRDKNDGKNRDEVAAERLLEKKSKLETEREREKRQAERDDLDITLDNFLEEDEKGGGKAKFLKATMSDGKTSLPDALNAYEDHKVKKQENATVRLRGKLEALTEAKKRGTDSLTITDDDLRSDLADMGLSVDDKNQLDLDSYDPEVAENRLESALDRSRYPTDEVRKAATAERSASLRERDIKEKERSNQATEEDADLDRDLKEKQWEKEFGMSVKEFQYTMEKDSKDYQLNVEKFRESSYDNDADRVVAIEKLKLGREKVRQNYMKEFRAMGKSAYKSAPKGFFGGDDPEAIANAEKAMQAGAEAFADARMEGMGDLDSILATAKEGISKKKTSITDSDLEGLW